MAIDEIKRLNRTVEAFCSFIESLSPEALTEQEWGPKEVLAHLVYHHKRKLEWELRIQCY